jgi:hypothetical protein
MRENWFKNSMKWKWLADSMPIALKGASWSEKGKVERSVWWLNLFGKINSLTPGASEVNFVSTNAKSKVTITCYRINFSGELTIHVGDA